MTSISVRCSQQLSRGTSHAISKRIKKTYLDLNGADIVVEQNGLTGSALLGSHDLEKMRWGWRVDEAKVMVALTRKKR